MSSLSRPDLWQSHFSLLSFANSFTALQFINRFNAACPPDWIMIGSSKKAEIRGRRWSWGRELFLSKYLLPTRSRCNKSAKMISFNFFSSLPYFWRMNYYVLVSDVVVAKPEKWERLGAEESERAASMLFMFAQCTFSKHNFMLRRKTEESFILIPSCTNTSARLKQGSEWWNNGKENCEKLDQKGTRESRKTFAQNNHGGEAAMLGTCNTQCAAKDQQGLNIRQKHVSIVRRTTFIPSTGPMSEPVESVECFKSWCARQGWFKSL